MATLRGAGVIVILKYVSPTLEAFFLWQAALSFMYVFIMRWGLWKKMPFFNQRPKFSRPEVRSIWRFALGMTGISAITFFLAQIDKVVLSKMLLLSDFGYYNLAFTIAFSITLIVGPVALAFFPRFATLVAAENKDELVRIYHKACRLMAAMVFPISFVLLFFYSGNIIDLDE